MVLNININGNYFAQPEELSLHTDIKPLLSYPPGRPPIQFPVHQQPALASVQAPAAPAAPAAATRTPTNVRIAAASTPAASAVLHRETAGGPDAAATSSWSASSPAGPAGTAAASGRQAAMARARATSRARSAAQAAAAGRALDRAFPAPRSLASTLSESSPATVAGGGAGWATADRSLSVETGGSSAAAFMPSGGGSAAAAAAAAAAAGDGGGGSSAGSNSVAGRSAAYAAGTDRAGEVSHMLFAFDIFLLLRSNCRCNLMGIDEQREGKKETNARYKLQ